MAAVVSLHWRYVMFGLIFVNLIYVDLILKICPFCRNKFHLGGVFVQSTSEISKQKPENSVNLSYVLSCVGFTIAAMASA